VKINIAIAIKNMYFNPKTNKENKMNTITVKVTPHDSKRFAIMVKVDGKTMLCEIAETYQEADLRIPVLKQRALTQFNLAQELEKKHS
jgi:altronate dehydratase